MNARDSKVFVSVLMPLGRMFEEIYVAVAACCRDVGAGCQRVDTEFSTQSALDQARSQITKADLIVADTTGKNPNVFYQIGYAHALNKSLIFLAQHGEDFSFDRRNHPTVIYAGNVAALKTELRQLLHRQLAQPTNGTPFPTPDTQREGVAAAAREKFLATFGDLLQAHQQQHHGNIYLEDEKTFVVENQEFSLALVQDLARRGKELGIRLKLL